MIIEEGLRKMPNSIFNWISRMTKLREWQERMATEILAKNKYFQNS